MDRELQKSQPLPSNTQELQQQLHIWHNLDQAVIRSIIDLMASWLVQTPYAAKGHADILIHVVHLILFLLPDC